MTHRLLDGEEDYPVRIQIALYDTLVAEVIVPYSMADETWTAYARARYDKGLPIGGACMSHYKSRRMWNVPVGSVIRK
jgi:hypothetical protein